MLSGITASSGRSTIAVRVPSYSRKTAGLARNFHVLAVRVDELEEDPVRRAAFVQLSGRVQAGR
jgi:hypothetical protein